jgi:hypothetical protein
MKSSPTIGKLAEALAKAQGEMDAAKKDSINPHFKSKYADLAAVIDAIKEPLSKNGLSYTQLISGADDRIIIITVLMHITGEWILSELPLIINKNDMQGMLASVTYGRRCSLSAIVGIAQDDDDGNTATAKPKSENKTSSEQKQQKEALPQVIGQNKDYWDKLNSEATRNGWSLQDIGSTLEQMKKKFAELTKAEYDSLLKHFMSNTKSVPKASKEFEDAVNQLDDPRMVK